MSHATGRTLLRGGTILTPGDADATAMLVVDGSVAWIGSDHDEAAAAHAETADVVDLQGRLVTPGFVDAHVHLLQTGLALASVDLSSAGSLDEALQLLAVGAAACRSRILVAYGWDETAWPGGGRPTRADVDAVVGDLPAYVARVDSHSAVVSSALLALGPQIAAADGWSDDGRVERDAHHAARDVTHGLWTEDDRRDAVRRALRNAASRGVTSVHELNAPHISLADDFRLIDELSGAEPLPEVVPYWGQRLDGVAHELLAQVSGLAGDLCVDGAIGSRTAALLEPYTDDPGHSGFLYLDRDAVRDHVVACTRAGTQAGFHVIGDRGMTEVAAGLRAAADVVGADAVVGARHRLEHVEMPSDDDVKTLADLGVVASVQPAFDAAWGGSDGLYERRLGVERARPMNPFGSMRRAGVTLAFGSDSPITPISPWAGVRAAVDHHAEAERLTVAEAFEAHTVGGHAARGDDASGVLAVGAPATYAVWDVADSRERAAVCTGLPDLRADGPLPTCVQTVVAGVQAYSASDREERR